MDRPAAVALEEHGRKQASKHHSPHHHNTVKHACQHTNKILSITTRSLQYICWERKRKVKSKIKNQKSKMHISIERNIPRYSTVHQILFPNISRGGLHALPASHTRRSATLGFRFAGPDTAAANARQPASLPACPLSNFCHLFARIAGSCQTLANAIPPPWRPISAATLGFLACSRAVFHMRPACESGFCAHVLF